MPRPRRHDSNKARVDAYRERHARKRRLELFVDHTAIERLDALAQAEGKSRSEIIEGLLLKTSKVSVNVTGHESKSTGNGTGNVTGAKSKVTGNVSGAKDKRTGNVTGADTATQYLQEVVKPAIEALLPLGRSLSDMGRRLDEQGIRPSLKPRGSGKWYSPGAGRQGAGGGGAPYLKKVMLKLGLWKEAN
jgi:hypothetical protein